MKPIYINFKPSKILNTLLILACMGSVSLLILVEFSNVLKLVLVVLIVSCTAYNTIKKALLLMPWSFIGLHINIKNEWLLQCKNGRNVKVIIRETTVVTPYLTILNFDFCPASFMTDASDNSGKTKMQRYLLSNSLVILPDSIDAENYRQLRMRLRWGTLALG